MKKNQRWAIPQDNGTFNLEDGNGELIEENINLEEFDEKLVEKHTHEDGSIFLSAVEREIEEGGQ